jgi:hypothetical protein
MTEHPGQYLTYLPYVTPGSNRAAELALYHAVGRLYAQNFVPLHGDEWV